MAATIRRVAAPKRIERNITRVHGATEGWVKESAGTLIDLTNLFSAEEKKEAANTFFLNSWNVKALGGLRAFCLVPVAILCEFDEARQVVQLRADAAHRLLEHLPRDIAIQPTQAFLLDETLKARIAFPSSLGVVGGSSAAQWRKMKGQFMLLKTTVKDTAHEMHRIAVTPLRHPSLQLPQSAASATSAAAAAAAAATEATEATASSQKAPVMPCSLPILWATSVKFPGRLQDVLVLREPSRVEILGTMMPFMHSLKEEQ